MNLPLRGETVVISGGAIRLGRAIALECARQGASVAFTFHNSHDAARQTLDELRALHDENSDATYQAYGVDVRETAHIDKLVNDVETDFGGATMLVNNAAIFRRTPFETLSENDFDEHIQTNLKAPFWMCRQFGALMVKRGGGAIVNIADIHAHRPLKNYVPYCVSKAGLVMLTQSLALAMAPTVRVNAICPGTIELPQAPDDEENVPEMMLPKIPLGRLGHGEDVAKAVLFALSAPYVSGAIIPVDGAQSLR